MESEPIVKIDLSIPTLIKREDGVGYTCVPYPVHIPASLCRVFLRWFHSTIPGLRIQSLGMKMSLGDVLKELRMVIEKYGNDMGEMNHNGTNIKQLFAMVCEQLQSRVEMFIPVDISLLANLNFESDEEVLNGLQESVNYLGRLMCFEVFEGNDEYDKLSIPTGMSDMLYSTYLFVFLLVSRSNVEDDVYLNPMLLWCYNFLTDAHTEYVWSRPYFKKVIKRVLGDINLYEVQHPQSAKRSEELQKLLSDRCKTSYPQFTLWPSILYINEARGVRIKSKLANTASMLNTAISMSKTPDEKITVDQLANVLKTFNDYIANCPFNIPIIFTSSIFYDMANILSTLSGVFEDTIPSSLILK